MAESTHRVDVFRVEQIDPHPNADRLELMHVWGYQCIVVKGQYKVGDLAAFIPPDSVVPDTEQFSFLWKGKDNPTQQQRRIRAIRLRGILSPGLVIEAPEGASEGDDVSESIGVTHFEPQINPRMITSSRHVAGPPIPLTNTMYDVENGFRYGNVIPEGTLVYVTEKLHGANARYVMHGDILYCGSRKHWTEDTEEKKNIWWKMAEKYEGLPYACMQHPDHIIYGEVYGSVQSLKYNATQDDPLFFAMFDIFDGNSFLPYETLLDWSQGFEIPMVPIIGHYIPYSFETVSPHAGGPSLIDGADHDREGIVVTTHQETYFKEIGRGQVKFVSGDHLADNEE